jgi:hypothetical protein
MVKIRRTEKRISVPESTAYFGANLAAWQKLKDGGIVSVPDKDFEDIKKAYGDSIQIVETKEEKIEEASDATESSLGR